MRRAIIVLVCVGMLVMSGKAILFAQSENDDLANLHSIFVEKSMGKLSRNTTLRNLGAVDKVKPLTLSYAAEMVSILVASQQDKLAVIAGYARSAAEDVRTKKVSWFAALKNRFVANRESVSQTVAMAKTWIPELKKTVINAAPAYSNAVNSMASGTEPEDTAAETFLSSFDQLQLNAPMKNRLKTATKRHFLYVNNTLKSCRSQAK